MRVLAVTGLPARSTVVESLAAAILIASAAVATAQVARNGPEWGGKDHQPTQAEVGRREDQAGVLAPPAQREQDNRSVDQLDRQLLRDEAVDPPRNPARPTPP